MNKNIYTKLQAMRKEFHSRELKKSGENKFAGFKYFELRDIIPVATELLDKYQLTTFMNCTKEGATLTLVNSENPVEQIVFGVPHGECALKGCHEIQNIGAVITYQKRYLFLNLFDVIENDGIDATSGSDTVKKLSDSQVNRLYAIANSKGHGKHIVDKAIKRDYNVEEANMLTKEQYEEICSKFQNIN